MEKKKYVSPIADKLEFDYRENVVASPTVDASHCFSGRNQGQCQKAELGNNWKHCGGSANPGQCLDD